MLKSLDYNCQVGGDTIGAVAQLVEHGTHKPRVGGSIPPRAMNFARDPL